MGHPKRQQQQQQQQQHNLLVTWRYHDRGQSQSNQRRNLSSQCQCRSARTGKDGPRLSTTMQLASADGYVSIMIFCLCVWGQDHSTARQIAMDSDSISVYPMAA